MSLKHALTGPAGRKLFLVEWLVAAAVLAVVGYGGMEAFSQAAGAGEVAGGTSQKQEEDIPRACYAGVDGPEEANFDPKWTCYKLGLGPDLLNAEAATQGLLVEISETRGRGRITTGSGDDIIVTGQWGEISSGAGDDDIALVLHDPSETSARIHIDPGPGDDFIDLVAAQSVDLQGEIVANRGSVKANLICQKGMMDVSLIAGSKTTIAGICPVRIKTSAAGDEPTSIRATGGRHFEADLQDLTSLELDVSTQSFGASAMPQVVNLHDIGYGELRYRATSSAPVSFYLSGKDLASSSSLFVDIEAPEGALRLVDAGHEAWRLHAGYESGGLVSLTFPDGDDFSLMTFPLIEGQARTLEILGCFDQVLLVSGEELTRRMEGCSQVGEVDIALGDDGAIRTLALLRNGQTARLRLGPGALDVSHIKVRRRPKDEVNP